MSSQQPQLLVNLRAALACLYSLPSQQHEKHPNLAELNPSPKQAHDFLLDLQSRNVRRKLQSQRQRQADIKNNKQPQCISQELAGSTWLACLALLCQSDARPEERLFSAQTLLHRVRRSKLSEAIDWELEDLNQINTEATSTKVCLDVDHLVRQQLYWMQQLHPSLLALGQAWCSSHSQQHQHEQHITIDEDQVKGELTILMLSALSYWISRHANENNHATQNLVFLLASTVAATALRLKYTPPSTSNTITTTTAMPLVTMVLQSLASVVSHEGGASTLRSNNTIYYYECRCVFLAALPDALLGSPGGARGRMSIDPRCLQAAHEELKTCRTGVELLWQALGEMPSLSRAEEAPNTNNDESRLHASVLATCERWAKFLPLPLDLIHHSVPLCGWYLSNRLLHPSTSAAALAYLTAIFEGGARTPTQILSFSLGLENEQRVQQTNKKKQSSKSKRRQEELLERSTNDSWAEAEQECWNRGEAAVKATELIWEGLKATTRSALASSNADNQGGEGPVGCFAACANAFMPHLLKRATATSSTESNVMLPLMELFQEVCSHPTCTVRALSYEPLFTLHDALLVSAKRRVAINSQALPTKLELAVVEHLVQCSMRLATRCGYPDDYFVNMSQDNDEELEIERNDVRDVLRTMADSQGSAIATTMQQQSNMPSSNLPLDVTMRVLDRLVQNCSAAILEHEEKGVLPPETAVHALSSLAKPLNRIAASLIHSNIGSLKAASENILQAAFHALGTACRRLIHTLPVFSPAQTLPISRLASIATASLAPSFAAGCALVEASSCGRYFAESFALSLDACVHAAALSLIHLPELFAASTLDHTPFDIRGAMRGPGGEDHVGCLALMRLAFESDSLALAMARSSEGTPLLLELCKLYEELKTLENRRSPGVSHGTGVAPKSRRILLGTISRISLLETSRGIQADEASATTSVLKSLLQGTIRSIADSGAALQSRDPHVMFRLCEATFDLASFSQAMISPLFSQAIALEDGSDRAGFVNGLVTAGAFGYCQLFSHQQPEAVHIQWGRFRGALLGLVRSAAADGDLPHILAEAIVAWNQAECEAIFNQCTSGPTSMSSIFNEVVISETVVPAGHSIRSVGEVLDRFRKEKPRQGLQLLQNCIEVLQKCSGAVHRAILHQCPEPKNHSFLDPRPALCEVWLMALDSMINSLGDDGHERAEIVRLHPSIESLLSECCCTAVLLLFYTNIGKFQNDRVNGCGMSLDGPQTRALMDFLTSYFLLGPDMFQRLALQVRKHLHIEFSKEHVWDNNRVNEGIAAVGASLFRAASGALPPWTIEGVPPVYAALYQACGADPHAFGQVLFMAMDIRTAQDAVCFGGLEPGKIIAGRYFEQMKDAAKQTFVDKAMEIASRDTIDGWRRFKVLLKQACGGKKKDAGFNLKPGFTNWDCTRI